MMRRFRGFVGSPDGCASTGCFISAFTWWAPQANTPTGTYYTAIRHQGIRALDPDPDTVLELGDLRIEVGGREVFVDGERTALTPKEFDLLVTLIEHRGIVLTREQLLEQVWGFTFLGDSRTIDVHVRQLRRKLGDACPIQTVWGTGYKVAAKR